MKACMNYVISDWQSILVGGAVIVGVVIFILGCLKVSIVNRIHNKMLRKTLLSFLSVALVFPTTAAYTLYNGWSWEYYWWLCGLFALATIVVYWFYEGTHLREGLAWIGKTTVGKFLVLIRSKPENVDAALRQLTKDANKDAKTVLKAHRYKEDDLNNL